MDDDSSAEWEDMETLQPACHPPSTTYIKAYRAAFGSPFVSSSPNYTAANLVLEELTSPRQNRSIFLGGLTMRCTVHDHPRLHAPKSDKTRAIGRKPAQKSEASQRLHDGITTPEDTGCPPRRVSPWKQRTT